ncbi:DUF4097 family beta strand repeat protein [Flavobacteriaceae bacterium R38]|nr:DUF4097 family beta strand repeat protein [Flavobacteriaceae bacterium R38]
MKHSFLFTVFYLFVINVFSQDYTHSLEGINKVNVSSETTIVIKNHNKNEFLISEKENIRTTDKAKGLKAVFGQGNDNTSFGVEVEKDGSILKVKGLRDRLAKDLIIYVPKEMNVSLEVPSNNDIYINDLASEIEAKTNNGNIILKSVTGPVIIENNNGNVIINFDEIDQSLPTSIIASKGDIDISLPSDTPANLTLKTPRGEFYTDFDLELTQQSLDDKNNRKKRPIITKLNNGGVAITLIASYGNIYLRKK